MSAKIRTPVRTATRKDESRHDQWWYPYRCEKEGCGVLEKEQLQKCSACKMVQYCCKEHQKEDWKLHKQECKLFQKLGIRATFYNNDEMIKRYPLKPQARYNAPPPPPPPAAAAAAAVPKGSKCALCGRKDSEVSMTRTDCCGNIVCDSSRNYEPLTFSRDFCSRSHDRYTLCGYHGAQEDCNKAADWRECDRCAGRLGSRLGADVSDTADRLWRGLNSYNYCPMLSKDVPKHALCDVCCLCKKKFMSGVQGFSFMGDGMTCLDCSMSRAGNIPPERVFRADDMSLSR